MSILVPLTEYLRRRAADLRRRRTERYISNLPLEIQKDIGWPGGVRSAHKTGPATRSNLNQPWQR